MLNELELTEEQITEIFDAQREFNCFVVKDWQTAKEWNFDKKREWISKQSTAYSMELSELLDCTNWKWWMKKSEEDTQNIHVELVDMLHFLVSIYQAQNSSRIAGIARFIEDLENAGDTMFDDLDSKKWEEVSYDLYLNAMPNLRKLKQGDSEELMSGFVDLCRMFKLKGQMLYDKYFLKMEVNLERQRKKNGYSKETKDKDDSKHI